MPRPFMVEPYIETWPNLSFFYAPGIGYLQNTRLVWIAIATMLLVLYAGWRLLVASLRCGSRALQDASHPSTSRARRVWAGTRLLVLSSPALLAAWAWAGAERMGDGNADAAMPQSADTLSIDYLLRQLHVGSDPGYIMQMVYSQSFYDKVLDASLPVEDLLTDWGEGYAQAQLDAVAAGDGTGRLPAQS